MTHKTYFPMGARLSETTLTGHQAPGKQQYKYLRSALLVHDTGSARMP